jgi:hypothetical protein
MTETSEWFEDVPVLGQMTPEAAAQALRELGDEETAAELDAAAAQGGAAAFGWPKLWKSKPKAWQHTAHSFGYLAPASGANGALPIVSASSIPVNGSLRNTRIKITLDHLRVAEYPGGGTHRILFDFYAQNQLPESTEHAHFNSVYRVREGERAAIVGYPIFVGLNVGSEGVAFKCFTVNVKNDADEAFLGFLDSDVFKQGLKLASTVQPAIALLSQTAIGLTRAIASRNRNVPVQDFYLGLDFGSIATRARLALGSYLAVQIPETLQVVWDWNDWIFQPGVGQVVSKSNPGQLIPYNYIVFSISKVE